MTAGEKRSDISQRLRRPLRAAAVRSPKSLAAPAISAPPKAAVAADQSKADVRRRKSPFDEMLRQNAADDDASSAFSSLSDGDEVREQGPGAATGLQDGSADAKIAELERTLVAVRQERQTLLKELEELQRERTHHHGHAHREGADANRRPVQGGYSRSPTARRPVTPNPTSLQPDYDMETSPLRSLAKPREDAAEKHELRARVAELQGQHAEQDAAFRARLEQHMHSRSAEWSELTGRLHHAEKESQERLQQLLDLKHSISALTRMESQVTDSELAERADQLHHRLREWVITNYRRAKLDFSNVSRETAAFLGAIHHQYGTIASSDRLAFYQSIIANSLMDIFGETVCVGLPTSGPLSPMRQLAAYLHDAGSEFRDWRTATIKALEKSEARHALREERDRMLHRMAANIEHHLFSLTSSKLTPHAQSALLAILQTAADLQHTLLLQKAQYRLHFFHHREHGGAVFDEETMESVNDVDETDGDGDTIADLRFAFCVFPCLEKFGDEFGEKAEVRNVLLRARVCSGVG